MGEPLDRLKAIPRLIWISPGRGCGDALQRPARGLPRRRPDGLQLR
ncbi:MAG: hypothetical protein R3F30_08700 [Planctomycetota bacterium]